MKPKLLYFVVSVICIVVMDIVWYIKFGERIDFNNTIAIVTTILFIIVVLLIIALIVAIITTRHNNKVYKECVLEISQLNKEKK